MSPERGVKFSEHVSRRTTVVVAASAPDLCGVGSGFRTVRVSVTDPDATDSSGDEVCFGRRRVRRFVNE
ncbi:hypothetical protein M569_11817, partial [Genlisea aurea]